LRCFNFILKFNTNEVDEFEGKIDEIINSYKDVCEFDSIEFDRLYGNIDFFHNKGKFKKYIEKDVYLYIKELIIIIHSTKFHFDNFQSVKRGNIPVIYDKILELQDKFFKTEIIDTEEQKTIKVYKETVYNIEKRIAFMRSKISHKKQYDIENTPFYAMAISKNNE